VLATRPAPLAQPIQEANRETERAAPAHVHKYLDDEKLAEAARLEADLGRSMNMTPDLHAQIERKVRELRGQQTITAPVGRVTLFEQYHFLKALAVRLDAGRGTECDRAMFEKGLQEYNANYQHIRGKE
jgi:hypothetical protein